MDGNKKRRSRAGQIRAGDLEPYTALRWLGTLFKGAAVFLAVAIVAEFVAGFQAEGWDAVPVLLGELARTVVLAVVLWGAGDLVRLLIDLGHDVRAERILIGRLVGRAGKEPGPGPAPRASPGPGPAFDEGADQGAAAPGPEREPR